MNYVSIFIIFILIISAIGGFKRGLIDGLINFVAFIFSFLLSLVLYKYFANYLALKYTLGIEIAKIISLAKIADKCFNNALHRVPAAIFSGITI